MTNEPFPSASRDDALDRRIDAALRRRFEPPRGLERMGERIRPVERRRPWLALAAGAAAAVVLGALLARGLRDEAPAPPTLPRKPSLVARAPLVPDVPACRLVGPLEDAAPEPCSILSPDLAQLWSDMDSCQRSGSAAACGDDALNERLRETYGDELALRPEAAGLLHGPFGSREWPTGTILTSTSEDQTSVVIAERETTLTRCMEVELAEESGLHLFHWQVGDVVLTEITPHHEPRLLAYFE